MSDLDSWNGEQNLIGNNAYNDSAEQSDSSILDSNSTKPTPLWLSKSTSSHSTNDIPSDRACEESSRPLDTEFDLLPLEPGEAPPVLEWCDRYNNQMAYISDFNTAVLARRARRRNSSQRSKQRTVQLSPESQLRTPGSATLRFKRSNTSANANRKKLRFSRTATVRALNATPNQRSRMPDFDEKVGGSSQPMTQPEPIVVGRQYFLTHEYLDTRLARQEWCDPRGSGSSGRPFTVVGITKYSDEEVILRTKPCKRSIGPRKNV